MTTGPTACDRRVVSREVPTADAVSSDLRGWSGELSSAPPRRAHDTLCVAKWRAPRFAVVIGRCHSPGVVPSMDGRVTSRRSFPIWPDVSPDGATTGLATPVLHRRRIVARRPGGRLPCGQGLLDPAGLSQGLD